METTITQTPEFTWSTITGAVSYDITLTNNVTNEPIYTVNVLASPHTATATIPYGTYKYTIVANIEEDDGSGGIVQSTHEAKSGILAVTDSQLSISVVGLQAETDFLRYKEQQLAIRAKIKSLYAQAQQLLQAEQNLIAWLSIHPSMATHHTNTSNHIIGVSTELTNIRTACQDLVAAGEKLTKLNPQF